MMQVEFKFSCGDSVRAHNLVNGKVIAAMIADDDRKHYHLLLLRPGDIATIWVPEKHLIAVDDIN